MSSIIKTFSFSNSRQNSFNIMDSRISARDHIVFSVGELVSHIFSYLNDRKSLISCLAVCPEWRDMSDMIDKLLDNRKLWAGFQLEMGLKTCFYSKSGIRRQLKEVYTGMYELDKDHKLWAVLLNLFDTCHGKMVIECVSAEQPLSKITIHLDNLVEIKQLNKLSKLKAFKDKFIPKKKKVIEGNKVRIMFSGEHFSGNKDQIEGRYTDNGERALNRLYFKLEKVNCNPDHPFLYLDKLWEMFSNPLARTQEINAFHENVAAGVYDASDKGKEKAE